MTDTTKPTGLTRRVYRTADGELYVEVPGGLLEAYQYVDEGGFAIHAGQLEPLELLGHFTDAAIVKLVDEA